MQKRLDFAKNQDILCSQQAPIAQLVEQMTLNHWVLGSSPRGRTNLNFAPYEKYGAFFIDIPQTG